MKLNNNDIWFSKVRLLYNFLSLKEQNELGATFILSVVLGILFIGGGLISLSIANSNKINETSNARVTKAIEIAEGGANRYLEFLVENPSVATFCANADAAISSCNTGTTWANIASPTGWCDTNLTSSDFTNINNKASTAWQSFGGSAEYRLISYSYQAAPGILDNQAPGTATLTVEGRTSSNSNGSGITRIELEIPITPSSDECPIPGIWAKSTGTVKVSSHINGTINGIVRKTGSAPPSTDFPANSLYGATIYDSTTSPSVASTSFNQPPIPSSIPSPYYTIFSHGDATTGYLDLSVCSIRLPRKGGERNAFGSCTSIIQNAFNGGLDPTDVLPVASADVAAADNRYHYLIPSDGFSTGRSLTLSNSAILIEPDIGKKVVLYLQGDISGMSGTGSNGTSPAISLATSASRDSNPNDQSGYGCELTSDTGTAAITTFINQGTARNLEIYGADGSPSPHWSNSKVSSIVNMSGNTRINAFMHFPAAQVLVSQGLISGAVWATTFDFSNTSGCTVGLVQNSVGNVLSANTNGENIINNFNSWQREATQ